MKCQIQWINADGRPTPDENDAVMMAHAHESVWSLPAGGVGNQHIGYNANIRESFPICQAHYSRVTDVMRFPRGGWSFTPIEATTQAQETTKLTREDQ